MQALAVSCEELRARTGNPPLSLFDCEFYSISGHLKTWVSGIGMAKNKQIHI
jgi:hypothetical protein